MRPQAAEVLKLHRIGVVCVESRTADGQGATVGAGIKEVEPHIPVVLIHHRGVVPAQFEKYVDVVIDEPDFEATAQRLIEELRDTDFPFFVRWFDDWMRRSSGLNGVQSFYIC